MFQPPFVGEAVEFRAHSGHSHFLCLFLFLAFREEELQRKVSWQLIPGQRFETACFSLIRNHLCALTSPLNLGFYRHSLLSLRCFPHMFPLLFPLWVFFFPCCFLPLLRVSWRSGGFSLTVSTLSTTQRTSENLNAFFHANVMTFWLLANLRLQLHKEPRRADNGSVYLLGND